MNEAGSPREASLGRTAEMCRSGVEDMRGSFAATIRRQSDAPISIPDRLNDLHKALEETQHLVGEVYGRLSFALTPSQPSGMERHAGAPAAAMSPLAESVDGARDKVTNVNAALRELLSRLAF